MYREIFQRVEKQGALCCMTVLSGEHIGSKCAVGPDGLVCWGSLGREFWEGCRPDWEKRTETGKMVLGELPVFWEQLADAPRMVLCGGGHVARPMCVLGKLLGFQVTVFDDREEFVTAERFPDAAKRIYGEFSQLAERIEPYGNAYYVVFTRGHMADEICVEQILRRPFCYLGMIGSRKKVAKTKEILAQRGFSEEAIGQMHAPIGLKLGGQLPEEIAVSIAAEIIQVRNARPCTVMEESIKEALRLREEGVMVTIVQKEGSSPRGAGSRMLVGADGAVYGSIGGGIVEYQAMADARKGAGRRAWTQTYVLDNEQARSLGMICGGRVEVLFETLSGPEALPEGSRI